MLADQLRQIFHRIRGRQVEFDLAPYQKVLAQIDRRAEEFQHYPASRLRELSHHLISRARAGTVLDKLLVEVFALGREAASRTVGMRPFDVQMLGGIALHRSKLIEMQTGEGKTLVAVLPACLNALTGQGVHILTFNDYLARRDAQWMGPVYQFLGLTVGFVQEGMAASERRQAYQCDVTYVTAKEAGFDYLRDHLCLSPDALVHRPFHCALVDEADSILIDEARVPLVIAGSTEEVFTNPYEIADFVRTLKPGLDYDTDGNARNAYFTDTGLDRVEKARQITLFHMDRCWAEYLDYVAHVREGIHLVAAGGSPLDEYHKTVGRAFCELLASIDDNVVATFLAAEITSDGIDMEKEGLKGPSSTWTYLINDHPFGDWFQRLCGTMAHSGDLIRSLRRAFSGSSKFDPEHK